MNPEDPLILTEEIVKKYHDFIEYMIQRLKEEDEQENQEEEEEEAKSQRWNEIVEKGKQLVKDVIELLKNTFSEMACLKGLHDFFAEYAVREAFIPSVFNHLGKINSRLANSPHIRIVSDVKIRGNVVSMCLVELRNAKQQLCVMMAAIKLVKQLEIQRQRETE